MKHKRESALKSAEISGLSLEENPIDLRVDLAGIQMKNPVMVASGTFGYGEEYSQFIDLKELGAVVTKSITLLPRPGNRPPFPL